MRVLQVTNVYHPELQFGGPPQKIHALSVGLQQAGIQVDVATFLSTDRRASIAHFDGVAVHYMPWCGWELKQWPLDLIQLSERVARADIVHCYGIYNALCPLAIREARRLSRPVLLEPLGQFVPRGRNKFAKWIYNILFTAEMAKRADRIVATSEKEIHELAVLAAPPKLVLRRNGVDLDKFKQLPADGNFRNKMSLPEGVRVILFVGRISPVKNLEQLISAFAIAGIAGTVLILAGPAEPAYQARLRSQVAALRQGERVLFCGPLFGSEMLAALKTAELFVLPSLMESYGNSAAEAVAAGVPVLLTDTCGVAPIIHRRAGLAVPLGAGHLAKGLQTMMGGGVRDFMRQKEAVKSELSWEEPLRWTREIYGKLSPSA